MSEIAVDPDDLTRLALVLESVRLRPAESTAADCLGDGALAGALAGVVETWSQERRHVHELLERAARATRTAAAGYVAADEAVGRAAAAR